MIASRPPRTPFLTNIFAPAPTPERVLAHCSRYNGSAWAT